MVRKGFHTRKGYKVKRKKVKVKKGFHVKVRKPKKPKTAKKPHKRGFHVHVKKKSTTAAKRKAAKALKRKASRNKYGFATRFGPEYSTPETQRSRLSRKAFATRVGSRRLR